MMESVIQEPFKEYDASIFTDENQANTYLCTICQYVCQDVVSVECGNGHIFCRVCMENYVKHSKSNQCPNCQKPIRSIHNNQFVDRLIQSLQVKCVSCIASYIEPYSTKLTSECAWRGALREVDKHYQTQCLYALLRCKQCGMDDILRKDSEYHITKKCPYTIVECVNKKQGCNMKLSRNQLAEHLDKFCRFRSLHCPYTKHGCLFTKKNGKVPKKELEKHLQCKEYRILHLELQIHSLTKQVESMSHHNKIQYNINNNNININNNINNHHFPSSFQHQSIISTPSHHTNCNSTHNLLFAFVGSDEGKYAQRNTVLCVDIRKGVSQTLLDPLSIALMNSTYEHTSHHSHNTNFNTPPLTTAHSMANVVTPHTTTTLKRAYSQKLNTSTPHNHHRCWDIRNHGACVASNTCVNNQKCTVLFRVGGWNSNDEQEIALSQVDGYIVERNQWLHQLPDLPTCSSGNGCVYSNNYGLMVVGGESPAVTDTLYQLPFGVRTNPILDTKSDDEEDNDVSHDDDEEKNKSNSHYYDASLKWKKLKSMKRARTNLALSSFTDRGSQKEYIFVCGGYNDGESLKWCELYHFDTDTWHDVPKSMYRHQSAGCCYWENGNGMNQNTMIVIGGYPEAKLVEEYSFYKNKWYKLPSTQHNHQFLPSIWVYTDPKINPNGCGILLCAGNRCNLKPLNDRTATGYVEFFDKRESIQKWHTLYSLRDLIYFGLHCKIDSKEDDGRRVRRIFR